MTQGKAVYSNYGFGMKSLQMIAQERLLLSQSLRNAQEVLSKLNSLRNQLDQFDLSDKANNELYRHLISTVQTQEKLTRTHILLSENRFLQLGGIFRTGDNLQYIVESFR